MHRCRPKCVGEPAAETSSIEPLPHTTERALAPLRRSAPAGPAAAARPGRHAAPPPAAASAGAR